MNPEEISKAIADKKSVLLTHGAIGFITLEFLSNLYRFKFFSVEQLEKIWITKCDFREEQNIYDYVEQENIVKQELFLDILGKIKYSKLTLVEYAQYDIDKPLGPFIKPEQGFIATNILLLCENTEVDFKLLLNLYLTERYRLGFVMNIITTEDNQKQRPYRLYTGMLSIMPDDIKYVFRVLCDTKTLQGTRNQKNIKRSKTSSCLFI